MAPSLRCLLVWLVTTVATGATAWWALAGVGPVAAFDDLVAATAGGALAACAGWAWLGCTVVVAQAVVAGGLPVRRLPGVPAWAARVVLAACGVAALGVAPAHASTYEVPAVPPAPASTLDGLPFPDRAVGPAYAAQARRESPPTASGVAGPVGGVVVRPGDSLWRIAARGLAPGASDAEVAVAVAALHDLNRDVVGPDPDLIHPGIRLRLTQEMS